MRRQVSGFGWTAVGLLALLASAPASADDGDTGTLERIVRAADERSFAWAEHLARGSGQPSFVAYARWRALVGGPPTSFENYRAFLERYPDWPDPATLRANAEAALDDRVTPAERLTFFAGRAPLTRQGRLGLAEALLAAGRTGEAARLVRQSWVEDDFLASEAARFRTRWGRFLAPADHAARLDRLLWDKQHAAARLMLSLVGSAEKAVAQARLDLQRSAPGVDRSVAVVPKAHRTHAGLLFDRLEWRRRNGREDAIVELLLDLPDDLGRPERWWPIQQRLARELLEAGQARDAYRIAARHGQVEGPELAEAEWLAGWIALRFRSDAETAARHFATMWQEVGTPISRGRAAYWAGRAAAAQGRAAAAEAWYERAAGYPTSFYGQLAARTLGLAPVPVLAAVTEAPGSARRALSSRASAQVAEHLCRLEDSAPAQPFFRALGAAAKGEAAALQAVVDLAENCARPDLALAAARSAQSAGGAVLPHALYPMPASSWTATLRKAAAELPLSLGVARQESLFYVRATSPVGALGLLQLMPGTARAMAREVGLPYSRSRLIGDPLYNLRLGSHYLATQLASWGNEPALALAAYNAGPSRVNDWVSRFGDPRGGGDQALIDWIEQIPFAETRNYVQRVLEARAIYAARLDPPLAAATIATRERPVPRAKPAGWNAS